MADNQPRPYVVWRRSDGYVGCTVAVPRTGRDTFDVLLTTQDWKEALSYIQAERDERHFAVVKSWNSNQTKTVTDKTAAIRHAALAVLESMERCTGPCNCAGHDDLLIYELEKTLNEQ